MLQQLNVRLTTCTCNFYLSLHTQKSSSPQLSLVCAIYLHLLKYMWEDDPPLVHSPTGPVHLVFTGALTNQDLGFLVLLSIITRLVCTKALADVRCHFWSIFRWSAKMTLERWGVHLVVRECSELAWLWLNGVKSLGSSLRLPYFSGCHCHLQRWENTATKPNKNRTTNNLNLHRNTHAESPWNRIYNQLFMSD